jgi:hypothetical protein
MSGDAKLKSTANARGNLIPYQFDTDNLVVVDNATIQTAEIDNLYVTNTATFTTQTNKCTFLKDIVTSNINIVGEVNGVTDIHATTEGPLRVYATELDLLSTTGPLNLYAGNESDIVLNSNVSSSFNMTFHNVENAEITSDVFTVNDHINGDSDGAIVFGSNATFKLDTSRHTFFMPDGDSSIEMGPPDDPFFLLNSVDCNLGAAAISFESVVFLWNGLQVAVVPAAGTGTITPQIIDLATHATSALPTSINLNTEYFNGFTLNDGSILTGNGLVQLYNFGVNSVSGTVDFLNLALTGYLDLTGSTDGILLSNTGPLYLTTAELITLQGIASGGGSFPSLSGNNTFTGNNTFSGQTLISGQPLQLNDGSGNITIQNSSGTIFLYQSGVRLNIGLDSSALNYGTCVGISCGQYSSNQSGYCFYGYGCGYSSQTCDDAVAMGANCLYNASNKRYGVFIGTNINNGSTGTSEYSVVVGNNSNCTNGSYNTLIGSSNNSAYANVTLIGSGLTASAANQCVLGTSSQNIQLNGASVSCSVPISTNSTITTLAGSAGNVYCSTPFNGTALKQSILNVQSFTGTVVYTFPTAYTYTPSFYGPVGGTAVITLTTTTATIVKATGTATGVYTIVGF